MKNSRRLKDKLYKMVQSGSSAADSYMLAVYIFSFIIDNIFPQLHLNIGF